MQQKSSLHTCHDSGCVLHSALKSQQSLSAVRADASVCLQLPAGRQQVLPYALTVGPPLLLALSFPDLFFRALDVAGTYGRATLPSPSILWTQITVTCSLNKSRLYVQKRCFCHPMMGQLQTAPLACKTPPSAWQPTRPSCAPS